MFLYISLVTISVLIGFALSKFLQSKPKILVASTAFSAGVLLAVCLLFLIPESLALYHAGSNGKSGDLNIGYALAAGFFSLLLVERYLFQIPEHLHCPTVDEVHTHGHSEKEVGWFIVIALSLHGLFDGVALYLADTLQVGPALIGGLILHKMPEAGILFALLKKAKVKTQFLIVALFIYAIASPIGTFAASGLLRIFSQRGLAWLMGFIAGSLLHLVTGHLLPEATESTPSKHLSYALLVGGFSILLLARLLGGT